MSTFYTYIHLRESDNAVFYVGKGKNRRAWSQDRNPHWLKTVAKHGLKVEICAKWATEIEAFEHEKFLLECFRALGCRLVNMTTGGEGVSGRIASTETRARISAANTGKKRSEETLLKMHAVAKNPSAETRAKMSAARKGKARGPQSAETRAKIGAANRGKTHSEETRAKLKAARQGREYSSETRAKLSLALKTRHAKRRALVEMIQGS